MRNGARKVALGAFVTAVKEEGAMRQYVHPDFNAAKISNSNLFTENASKDGSLLMVGCQRCEGQRP